MTAAPSNSVLDAVQALERAPSISKLKEIFRTSAERHGYSMFLCSAPPPVYDVTTNPILYDEWPGEWKRQCVQQKHYLNDPMLSELHRTAEPFLWSDAQKRKPGTRAEREVMAEAAIVGMCEGFVVPIYGIGGQVHGMTIAGTMPRVDSYAKAELHLLSMYAYARAKILHRRTGAPPVSIGRRDREALHWAAAGKTDWEIGEILRISESAAHKRIENAKRKLGVATRMQAVVEAIRGGYIQI